jgi:hypothetical protein
MGYSQVGSERPPKANMHSDSRKAQYNSFAHHRANLLFSRRPAEANASDRWAAVAADGAEPQDRAKALRERVIAGVLGFKPSASAAAR